jgi:hypothetical protein
MTNGFDKLLRESLAGESADSNGADCPDAAIVAGWFDGTLSHAERTAVEAHAATCARCQATIAALVRTVRPGPRAWWRAPAMQWLVPVAVAAGASLILWTGVLRTDDDAVAPAATSGQFDSSARVTAAVPETRAGATASPRGRVAAGDAPAEAAPLADADARKAEQLQQRARVSAATPVTANAAKAATPPAEAEKPQDVAAPLPEVAESVRRSDAPSPAAAAMAGAVAAPPPAPVAPRTEQVNATATRETTLPSLDRAFLQSPAGAGAGRAGGASLIQSPDLSVRWRITGQSQVERSADGGLSWQTQTTGVNAGLVAGVAPSSTVCWLVGLRGVVVKTTDGGQTWTRVAFPEEINLVGVVADDDKVATVTAAGGRQVHTTDGGVKWR